MKIATVINYCTNDYRFLRHCVAEAAKFSYQMIVPVCSHFFNGEPENRPLLHRSYEDHPNVQFVEFAYSDTPYGIYSALTSNDDDWSHYWHSTARYVGFHFVSEADYVLFLDVDEIVDGNRFLDWLKAFPVESYEALRFESYFYFGSAKMRATNCFPLNALMVKTAAIDSHEMLLDVFERKGVFDRIEGKKKSDIRGVDGCPLVHHYSWVRVGEELKKKVTTWGHRHDRDWVSSLPLDQTDTVYRFDYEEVQPFCDPVREIDVMQVDQKSLWRYNNSL